MARQKSLMSFHLAVVRKWFFCRVTSVFPWAALLFVVLVGAGKAQAANCYSSAVPVNFGATVNITFTEKDLYTPVGQLSGLVFGALSFCTIPAGSQWVYYSYDTTGLDAHSSIEGEPNPKLSYTNIPALTVQTAVRMYKNPSLPWIAIDPSQHRTVLYTYPGGTSNISYIAITSYIVPIDAHAQRTGLLEQHDFGYFILEPGGEKIPLRMYPSTVTNSNGGCTFNSGSNNVNIPLPAVRPTMFHGIGSVAGSTPVTLVLDCDTSETVKVIAQSSVIIDAQKGIIGLQSVSDSASGLGIELRDRNNGSKPVVMNDHSIVVKKTSETKGSISLDAQYIQTEPTVKEGTVDATVTLTVWYQ